MTNASPFLARPSGATGCIIVGEVAQAHDGSLGFAHAYIDAIAAAGADAVKFQTHIASAESTPDEPWRVKFSRQDATRYDYWRRMEFTEEQWHGLRQHADERGLLFLSSPFSLEAVDLLERVGVAAWKVASGEVANAALVDRMLATGRPVILSSGMSDLTELDGAVARVHRAGSPLAVLQCTTAYPCPPERIGINLLSEFRERYDCAVGLSDHSGTVFPGIAAATLGADIVEVHVTMHRAMFGPDVPASITLDELATLVSGVRFVERMHGNPVHKDTIPADMLPVRQLFTRSVVARVRIPAGVVIGAEHLIAKKPGTGIPAERLDSIVGTRARRTIEPDELLSEMDIEAAACA